MARQNIWIFGAFLKFFIFRKTVWLRRASFGTCFFRFPWKTTFFGFSKNIMDSLGFGLGLIGGIRNCTFWVIIRTHLHKLAWVNLGLNNLEFLKLLNDPTKPRILRSIRDHTAPRRSRGWCGQSLQTCWGSQWLAAGLILSEGSSDNNIYMKDILTRKTI